MIRNIIFVVLVLVAVCLPSFAFQSTPTITLGSSINPGITGQPVTFTATVAGTVGNPPPIPTGTISFLDSGTALYSPVTLNAIGVAVFTTSSLSAATHSITAVYSGDTNFLPVTSTAVSEVIVLMPGSDYTLSSDVTTQSVSSGSPVTFSLTVTPAGGYNGTVSFTCSGLPTNAACTFSPTSLSPTDEGTALTTSLTVATNNGATTSFNKSPKRNALNLYACLGGLGLLGIVWAGSRKRGRPRKAISRTLTLLTVVMIGLLAGCGGSNNSATGSDVAVGTYTFNVDATGTAGTNQGNTMLHQLSITLTVTASTM
jgi:hypothetical protein